MTRLGDNKKLTKFFNHLLPLPPRPHRLPLLEISKKDKNLVHTIINDLTEMIALDIDFQYYLQVQFFQTILETFWQIKFLIS